MGDESMYKYILQIPLKMVRNSSCILEKVSSSISYGPSDGVSEMSISNPLFMYELSKMRYFVIGGIILRASMKEDSDCCIPTT